MQASEMSIGELRRGFDAGAVTADELFAIIEWGVNSGELFENMVQMNMEVLNRRPVRPVPALLRAAEPAVDAMPSAG